MAETSMWLPAKEASVILKVDEQTLEVLREGGYLKPGSHWRSSTDPEQLPWKPKVFYRITSCIEIIECFQNNEAFTGKIAA